jgi:DNA-binding NarL/FixJ family response regulator
MRTVSPIRSDERRFLVIAGAAQRDWARLKRSFSKFPEVVLVRSSSKLADVLEECQKLVPCVLLVDYDFVAKDRPAEFAQKVQYGRSISILVTIQHEPTEALELLLRMGCMGFLRTGSPPRELRHAVEAVASGEVWAPRKLLARVFQDLLSANNPRKLTAREGEILTLVAQGYTNQQIAHGLCISRETVRWHMRMLYGKLGVHDRQSAISQTLRPGLGLRKPSVSENHPESRNVSEPWRNTKS